MSSDEFDKLKKLSRKNFSRKDNHSDNPGYPYPNNNKSRVVGILIFIGLCIGINYAYNAYSEYKKAKRVIKSAIVVCDSAPLRSVLSDKTIHGYIPKGTQISIGVSSETIMGDEQGNVGLWYRVNYQGVVGWVFSSCISSNGVSDQIEATAKESFIGKWERKSGTNMVNSSLYNFKTNGTFRFERIHTFINKDIDEHFAEGKWDLIYERGKIYLQEDIINSSVENFIGDQEKTKILLISEDKFISQSGNQEYVYRRILN